MITLDDRYNYDKNIKILEKIKATLTDKEVELIFVTNDEIQGINQEFLGKDYATDVLSFPMQDMPHSPLGSIVISIDKVIQLSGELGHKEIDELALLFIHGLLHLLGFDHETDSGEMRNKEALIIEEFGLPKSLILRNE